MPRAAWNQRAIAPARNTCAPWQHGSIILRRHRRRSVSLVFDLFLLLHSSIPAVKHDSFNIVCARCQSCSHSLVRVSNRKEVIKLFITSNSSIVQEVCECFDLPADVSHVPYLVEKRMCQEKEDMSFPKQMCPCLVLAWNKYVFLSKMNQLQQYFVITLMNKIFARK